jgi:CRP/FNR family transcriptional regulator
LPLVDVPTGVASFQAVWDVEALCERRFRRHRGEGVVASGDRFAGLVLVRLGSCKSSVRATHGGEQITAYHLAGDVLGAEAICTGAHAANVSALEDSEFWVLPLARLAAAAREDPSLLHHFTMFLSDQIARDRKAILVLGTMRAEQRIATFLLDLSDRYAANGYSRKEFVLRMTREEIGLHLGLSVETVSRVFSRLHREELVHVRGRAVRLLDRARLDALLAAPA